MGSVASCGQPVKEGDGPRLGSADGVAEKATDYGVGGERNFGGAQPPIGGTPLQLNGTAHSAGSRTVIV